MRGHFIDDVYAELFHLFFETEEEIIIVKVSSQHNVDVLTFIILITIMQLQ